MSETSTRNLWRTFIASLSFFFLIGSYYVLKPTRKPLLFTYVGKEYLHHFYNISVVVTLFAVVGYNRLVNHFSRKQLLRTLYAMVIGVFLCFALLLRSLGNQPAYDATMTTIYFFFVSLYVLFVTALFWSISHDLHKNQEAKKFYPYIFLGGQLGVIGGSKFTSTFIVGNNYELLLLIAAGGLGLTWLLIELFYIPHSEEDNAKPTPTGTLEDFQLFFKNRYVFFIGVIMVLATFTSTVSDQQFSWLVDNSILDDRAFYALEKSDMGNEKAFIQKLRDKKENSKLYNSLSTQAQQQINKEDSLSSQTIAELNTILAEKDFVENSENSIFAAINKEELPRPASFLGKLFFDEAKQRRLLNIMKNKLFLNEIYPENFLIITPKLIRDQQFLTTLYNRSTPLTNYIASFLKETTQKQLKAHVESKNESASTHLLYMLCEDINQAIKKKSFYNKEVFALQPASSDTNENFVVFAAKKFHKIKLSKRVSKELDKENLATSQIIVINKLILEESFPQLVNTQSSLQGQLWADNNFYMGICNILMCLIITPLLIYLLGPALGICLYPLVLFVGAIFFLEELSVYAVRYFAIIALSLNYTLYKVGFEIFYVPTDKNIKYKAKAVCDTFLFRLGDASSSLMVTFYLFFLAMNDMEYSLTNLSYVVFVIVFVWIISILKTGNLYQNLLKNAEVNNGQS